MNKSVKIKLIALLAMTMLALTLGNAVNAKTLRVANQGDALSMDPHSLNESLQLSFTGNVFDALVNHNKQLGLEPGLATSWKQTSPNVWRFELRKGVQFHDGKLFTADDVVFSFARAAGDGSDMKSYCSAIKEVRKINDHVVEIETIGAFPILPDVISLVFIMNKQWSIENKAEKPVDRRKGIENTASFKANGTGPFRVRERQPGVRTTLARFNNYWGPVDSNVTDVIFTPISNDATRVAALLSGEIDLVEPIPVQDVERIRGNSNLKVMQGPELRTIFLGMDQQRDELLYSSVKGKNPFKDKRVRLAFYQAIDIETIKTSVMRGASAPSNSMVAPGVKGFVPEIAKRLPFDQDASKKLLAEAGYPNGFEVTMNCPNDRYVNDGKICQAISANLARVGIKINLAAESKATYFPKILRRDTSFYLLGWTPGTYDSHNVLTSIFATPTDKGQGQFNLGAFSNAKIDELTLKVQSETDQTKRMAMIKEAFEIHSAEVGHIPLHQQALSWGMRKNIETVQSADNFMPFKWVVIK